MGSQLGDLKKLVGDIMERIDSICREKCKDFNLDEKEFFGKDREKENVEESATSKRKGSSSVPPSIEPVVNSASSSEDDVENDDDENTKDIDDELKKKNSQTDDDSDENDFEKKNPFGNIETQRDDKITYSYKYADNTVDPELEPKVNFDKPKKNKDDVSGVKNGLKKFGLKRLSKYALKKGYKSLAKRGLAKSGTKAGAKIGGKAVAKGAGKLGAKSLAKKLPFGLGLIPAAAFAADRAIEGDFSGAGLELASGATAAVPLVGTAGSLGIDAYLADRDIKKATGKGLTGHGMDKAGELAGKYSEHRIRRAMAGESFECFNTLYDRAKRIFESESGVNESVDGYCFDDYVMESKIDNLAVSKEEIDESKVFFGYGMLCESFGNDDEELRRLFRRISPDGKISMEDLIEKDTDMPDIIEAKRRIRSLLGTRRSTNGTSSTDFNAKEYKKALDLSTNPSGKLTNLQLLHKGLDQLGDGVASGLERNMLIPQELTRRLNIPKNLGRLAGAGVGGLLFGPVGALAGTALANWMANSHEKYKAKQYAKLHGLDDKNAQGKKDGYIGSLAGAGIGTLLGGPIGGILGAGVGHFLDRKTDAKIEPKRTDR